MLLIEKKMSGSARILQGYECLHFRQVKPISLFIPLDIKTKHVYFHLTIQIIALCILNLFKTIENDSPFYDNYS